MVPQFLLCASLSLGGFASNLLPEILQGSTQPLVAVDLGLPTEETAGTFDIRPAHFGIVLGQRLEVEWAPAACQAQDLLGEIEDTDLVRIAQVDRFREIDG